MIRLSHQWEVEIVVHLIHRNNHWQIKGHRVRARLVQLEAVR